MFQMFIANPNSYSTKLHTHMLAVLHNVVEASSSNVLVKAVRLAYQEVTMKLERNLLTPYTHVFAICDLYVSVICMIYIWFQYGTGKFSPKRQ
jgi:hypothetical protein